MSVICDDQIKKVAEMSLSDSLHPKKALLLSSEEQPNPKNLE